MDCEIKNRRQSPVLHVLVVRAQETFKQPAESSCANHRRGCPRGAGSWELGC